MGGGGGADGELTAQETALYDRQIRVWGVDAQKRLSKAHVLVCGMNGTTIEFCKNIVLAGVGSLSLMDDHIVTEDDLNTNFLIPPDGGIYGGTSRAHICCDSLKGFNQMVRVSIEKGDPSIIDGEFLDKFDTVVVSCLSLKTKLFINDNCRKRSKCIAFYAIDCKDSCGSYLHTLEESTQKDGKVVLCHERPFAVLENYESSEGLSPGETTLSDMPAVLAQRKDMCDRMEVIKAMSSKGDPIKNFFYFDAVDGKGVIEDVPPPAAS